MRPLSELEGVVLGLVGKLEPCTAYRIRVTLTESPSTFWSGSAGAVYPALKRLSQREYVLAEQGAPDGRGRKLLSLTKLGSDVLRAWILEGSAPAVVSGVFDPVRSRAFFLANLSVPERIQFARGCLGALEEYLDTTRADYERRPAAGEENAQAALGAVYEAEARVRWMKEVVRLQERPPGPDG